MTETDLFPMLEITPPGATRMTFIPNGFNSTLRFEHMQIQTKACSDNKILHAQHNVMHQILFTDVFLVQGDKHM